MKKLLAIILAVFAFSAQAKETITIVYSWTASDNAANFYRTLAFESNKIQDKYTFVVEAKPGAGASIGANYVDNNPDTTILAHSSALFIRPLFYPEGSYDVKSFKSIMPMCTAPFIVTSTKYKSWKEVPTDKPLTIGQSGNGTTTHLVAAQVAKNYPNMKVIAFKSTTDAFMSVLNGSTDFAVGFMGDAEAWLGPNSTKKVYVLGTTGKQPIKGIVTVPTLASQGFPVDLKDMNTAQQLFVSTKLPADKFKEVRAIFVKAATEKSVKDSNATDYCVPNNQMPDAELEKWFDFQNGFWKKIAADITIQK